jgi:cobalamin biosynthesis protein CobD/CbiB
MHQVRSSSTHNQRAFWGVLCLVVLTVLAMTVAWYWPEQPLLHFWLVAQAVPVLYVILAWWGAQAPTEDRDAV